MSQANRSQHKSILSSLTALGASERPVTLNSVARPGVVASVAAAGMSLLGCQAADADTITVSNPNVNIGFAAGDLSHATLNIGSLGPQIKRSFAGIRRSIYFLPSNSPGRLALRVTNGGAFAQPAVYGKKFSEVGSKNSSTAVFASVFTNGFTKGAFSNKYFDFSFTDSSSQTHYGWIYGSVTGGYSDLTYNLISYGYDTTPNEQIGAGDTGAAPTPEPSTDVMVAMAALILGAARVRKRNKARA
jgi:hypothetical protein